MKAISLRSDLPLTLAALLVVSFSTASAQRTSPLLLDTSEVRVMVRDTTGLPVRDAKVVMHVMKRGTDQGELEVRTDQDGRVEQDIIPIGNLVHLEILAPGYQAYRTDYQVNALVKNLVVRLKQQPMLQTVANEPVMAPPQEVAKNAPVSDYKEPQWVAKQPQVSSRRSSSVRKQPSSNLAKN
jgi:5-hydroxyisourate hydrolase-like protein (transthyretin family)